MEAGSSPVSVCEAREGWLDDSLPLSEGEMWKPFSGTLKVSAHATREVASPSLFFSIADVPH